MRYTVDLAELAQKSGVVLKIRKIQTEIHSDTNSHQGARPRWLFYLSLQPIIWQLESQASSLDKTWPS